MNTYAYDIVTTSQDLLSREKGALMSRENGPLLYQSLPSIVIKHDAFIRRATLTNIFHPIVSVLLRFYTRNKLHSVHVHFLCKFGIKSICKNMSFLQSFFKRYIPTVKAEDEEAELVDPQKVLREKCGGRPKCATIQEKLTACNDRVNSKSQTEETCLEELIDYVECVDHCVAETLFSKLK